MGAFLPSYLVRSCPCTCMYAYILVSHVVHSRRGRIMLSGLCSADDAIVCFYTVIIIVVSNNTRYVYTSMYHYVD
jgi:hypothetical protein